MNSEVVLAALSKWRYATGTKWRRRLRSRTQRQWRPRYRGSGQRCRWTVVDGPSATGVAAGPRSRWRPRTRSPWPAGPCNRPAWCWPVAGSSCRPADRRTGCPRPAAAAPGTPCWASARWCAGGRSRTWTGSLPPGRRAPARTGTGPDPRCPRSCPQNRPAARTGVAACRPEVCGTRFRPRARTRPLRPTALRTNCRRPSSPDGCRTAWRLSLRRPPPPRPTPSYPACC